MVDLSSSFLVNVYQRVSISQNIDVDDTLQ